MRVLSRLPPLTPLILSAQDLRLLLDHVRDSDALVVLQSAAILHRPWCLLEMHAAIEGGIPIIAIAIAGKGYDYATAANL